MPKNNNNKDFYCNLHVPKSIGSCAVHCFGYVKDLKLI
jgi:hypothetical protein